MYFWQELQNKIKAILESDDLVFSYPTQQKLGDLSLACFAAAKKENMDPNKLAEEWKKKISNDEELSPYFKDIKIVGAYINLFLALDVVAAKVIEDVKQKKDSYGSHEKEESEKIMVEYSNGNTHKEYHIGHLRNISYGDAISNIIDASGDKSIRVSYINDFGIHTAKTIWNWKNNPEYANRTEPKGYLLGKCYAEANLKIKERPEYKLEVAKIMQELESREGDNYKLWKESRDWSIEYFDDIYKELGIKFERIFYESDLVDEGLKIVTKLQEENILKQSEGAIIADLEAYGLGVLPVIRSDKTALYAVADLALAINKFSLYDLSESVYVVDVRQSLYFKQLFKILELLGYKQKLTHLTYDFLSLPEGMMSSRSGNIISYRDLKEKITAKLIKETRARRDTWSDEDIETAANKLAIAVIKFEMLKVSSDKEIVFNIDAALRFDGYTACYLEYSYARLKSILRKEGPSYFAGKTDLSALEEEREKELILKIAKYPDIITQAMDKKNPSEVTKYLFELAKMSNDYYQAVNILKSEKRVKKARLLLIKTISQVLRNGFELLGLPILEEM